MTKLTKAEREELPARIEAAIATVCSGMAAMSIPANPRDVDLVLADCAKALADLDAAEAERDARSDEAYEARELRSVLLRHNFAPCDTAACNCNGWHERSTGNGFYARFREIDEAVGEHDGQTLLDAVKQIVVERKAAVLWAEKAEKAMTCKGCGGTVSDHLAPDQGGCPGSFEIDGVQMVPLAGRDNAVAQRDRVAPKPVRSRDGVLVWGYATDGVDLAMTADPTKAKEWRRMFHERGELLPAQFLLIPSATDWHRAAAEIKAMRQARRGK